jgi:hypothetical protein
MIRVGWSIVTVLRTVRSPNPIGIEGADPGDYGAVLAEVARQGPQSLSGLVGDLEAFIKAQGEIDPDSLSPSGSLAYWLNLYNAGALALAGRASLDARDSVLREPGAFTNPFVTVAGESLSLDGIEHGKVRRFGDPRIHGALVCGAVSCPTLRPTPYVWSDLDAILDDQMRAFLAGGGAAVDEGNGALHLSRIFSWFSGDFVRPTRMPTFLPGRRSKLVEAIVPWMEPEIARWLSEASPAVQFQPYNWGLRCSVG